MSATPIYCTTSKLKDGKTYLISSNQDLVSHSFIREAWKDPGMYWVDELPEDAWETMLQNSCLLSVYRIKDSVSDSSREQESNTDPSQTQPGINPNELKKEDLEQIGFGRLVTDHTTIIYLTDVYISPSARGLGLGTWISTFVKQIADSFPFLRRVILMTAASENNLALGLYERTMGMKVFRPGDENKVCMMFVPDTSRAGKKVTIHD